MLVKAWKLHDYINKKEKIVDKNKGEASEKTEDKLWNTRIYTKRNKV